MEVARLNREIQDLRADLADAHVQLEEERVAKVRIETKLVTVEFEAKAVRSSISLYMNETKAKTELECEVSSLKDQIKAGQALAARMSDDIDAYKATLDKARKVDFFLFIKHAEILSTADLGGEEWGVESGLKFNP